MTAFPNFRYLTTFSFLILCVQSLRGESNCSFSFDNFRKASNFGSRLALYGDAKVVPGGLAVQVSGSSVYSSGRFVYKTPMKFVEGSPQRMLSFSTDFSFSLSPENGDGLAFVVIPMGFPLNVFDGGPFGLLSEGKIKFLGVEFDTLWDKKYGDVNGNHVGVDVDSFVSVGHENVSSIKLVMNNGEKLLSWIDYEASSKRLEIRLAKFGKTRPVDPLLSYSIDLSQMWKEGEKVFVGLSSSSGNSSQKCNVYSWSFTLRHVPTWMHSEPLDPNALMEKTEESPTAHKRSDCVSKILAALIFGTGCGALGVFLVLFIWIILGNRRPVMPEEYAVRAGEFEYKKFQVVEDKTTEEGKK